MANILYLWSNNRLAQFKTLLITYKVFDQRIHRIYELPYLIRLIVAVPLILAYLFHLVLLRTFGLIYDYLSLAIAKIRFFDRSRVKTIGNLPIVNQKCRALLLYAKNCEFTELDFNLGKNIFDRFSGHKSIIINCGCQGSLESHQLSINYDFLIVKPNWGYDFDGYAELVNRFSNVEFESLTFVNNSIATLGGLQPWLDQMETEAIESGGLSGLIQSISPINHFQSFAFTMSKKSLTPALLKWFSGIKPLKRKQAVVRFYELGLARKIQMQQLPHTYQIEFSQIREIPVDGWRRILGTYFHADLYRVIYARTKAGLGVNPTHHHWKFLLDLGVPILKRELISRNPENLPDVVDYIRNKHPEIIEILRK